MLFSQHYSFYWFIIISPKQLAIIFLKKLWDIWHYFEIFNIFWWFLKGMKLKIIMIWFNIMEKSIIKLVRPCTKPLPSIWSYVLHYWSANKVIYFPFFLHLTKWRISALTLYMLKYSAILAVLHARMPAPFT